MKVVFNSGLYLEVHQAKQTESRGSAWDLFPVVVYFMCLCLLHTQMWTYLPSVSPVSPTWCIQINLNKIVTVMCTEEYWSLPFCLERVKNIIAIYGITLVLISSSYQVLGKPGGEGIKFGWVMQIKSDQVILNCIILNPLATRFSKGLIPIGKENRCCGII